MPATSERVREVYQYYLNNGEAAALRRYSITSDTLKRYTREYSAEHGKSEGIERALFFADFHLIHGKPNHPSYELFKKFAREFKPDLLINAGDFIDFPYLSSFDKDKLKRLEGKRIMKDYDLANIELDELQGIQPNMIYLEGNHEERIRRLVIADPRFEGMIELPDKLLLNRGIEWVPLDEQPYRYGKLCACHGFYAGKYSAAQHLDKFAHNVVFGHVHKMQSFARNLAMMGETIQSWAISCLCDLNPSYMNGPADWSNGFAIINMDRATGNFSLTPINIVDNSILYDGRIFK